MTVLDFRQLAALDWRQAGRLQILVDFGENIVCPLTILNGTRGSGPTLLLTGGVHGDEFEGPALIGELARSLDPALLQGRLILAPVLNPSGLRHRQRCSPVDGKDLNRSFPGDARGTVSQRVAHAIHDLVIPHADIVYDIHAGGNTEAIMPSVMINQRRTKTEAQAAVAAAVAFGAPALVLADQPERASMLDGAAEDQGKVFGCVELGSFGSLTPQTAAIGRAGLHSLMRHIGMIDAAAVNRVQWRWSESRFFHAKADAVVVSNRSGYFIPGVSVGDTVEPGGALGVLTSLDDMQTIDQTFVVRTGGTVFVLSAGGPVTEGQLVAAMAERIPDQETLLRLASPPI